MVSHNHPASRRRGNHHYCNSNNNRQKNRLDGGMTILLWRSILLACLCSLSSVSARAILGIDLGSTYMKVALVRPGSPLEIVTNLHSKRKTEQLILFDNGGQRFYGADAAALLARKSAQTAAHISLALGRDDIHAVAKVRFRSRSRFVISMILRHLCESQYGRLSLVSHIWPCCFPLCLE